MLLKSTKGEFIVGMRQIDLLVNVVCTFVKVNESECSVERLDPWKNMVC